MRDVRRVETAVESAHGDGSLRVCELEVSNGKERDSVCVDTLSLGHTGVFRIVDCDGSCVGDRVRKEMGVGSIMCDRGRPFVHPTWIRMVERK